ncbi:MAG: hypothetical protein HOP29_19590 [Phycisphaerales bacterium]|nr:hypothetical protein [Phycisphaerales bacterium]
MKRTVVIGMIGGLSLPAGFAHGATILHNLSASADATVSVFNTIRDEEPLTESDSTLHVGRLQQGFLVSVEESSSLVPTDATATATASSLLPPVDTGNQFWQVSLLGRFDSPYTPGAGNTSFEFEGEIQSAIEFDMPQDSIDWQASVFREWVSPPAHDWYSLVRLEMQNLTTSQIIPLDFLPLSGFYDGTIDADAGDRIRVSVDMRMRGTAGGNYYGGRPAWFAATTTLTFLPEPSTLSFLAIGVVALAKRRTRHRTDATQHRPMGGLSASRTE